MSWKDLVPFIVICLRVSCCQWLAKVYKIWFKMKAIATEVVWLLVIVYEISAVPIHEDSVCGVSRVRRSIGGSLVQDAGSHPWTGFVKSLFHFCTCVLISNEWALTAAHCLDPLEQTTFTELRFGTLNASGMENVAVKVDKFFVHPGYSRLKLENDIALMHFREPVTYTNNVRPICLETSSEEVSSYQSCIASGFGRHVYSQPSDRMLREVDLSLVEKTKCQEEGFDYITENTLCAGDNGTGTCAGDSGGPLACQRSDGRFNLVGLSSYSKGGEGCGLRPSVFTRVSRYIDFIDSVMTNQEPLLRCQPLQHEMCKNVLPYSQTFVTSQEDLIASTYQLLEAYETCHEQGRLLACALVFPECSEHDQERVQPCRKLCLDVLSECSLTNTKRCNEFPVGKDGQVMCPYGPDPICHDTLTLESRVKLESPDYPGSYYPDQHCEWIITGQEGHDIMVKVNKGSLGTKDDVAIGTGTNPVDLSTFIRRLPDTVTSSFMFSVPFNEIWVTFASDSRIGEDETGFSLEILSLSDAPNGRWSPVVEACIRGHNDWSGRTRSLNACKRICEEQTSFRCLSIDYNGETCYNSRHNRQSLNTTQDFSQPCNAQTIFRFSERLDMDYGWTVSVGGCIKNTDRRVDDVDDIEACQQKCQDEKEFVCLSITYRNESCLLSRYNKESVRPAERFEHPCYENGWQYSERTDTAYYWTNPVEGCIHSNHNWVGEVLNLEACQDRCLSEDDFTCLSIDYEDGRCHLHRYNRNTIRPVSDYTQPCYDAGWTYSERVTIGSWTQDLDACIRGHNMKELEVPDLVSCRLMCSQTEGCCSFDYRSSDQQCLLSAYNRATVSPSTTYTEPCYINGYRYSERVDKFCKYLY